MLIDSHCHLDFDVFKDDLENVLQRAHSLNVNKFVTISTKVTEFYKIIRTASHSKDIFCSFGIHPNYSEAEPKLSSSQIISLCTHPKVIGIGETGLDYHYDYSDKQIQKTNFLSHIVASQETQLPLIIHTREAEDATIEILKDTYSKKQYPILLHCFTSKLHLAEEALKLGACISFSGIITFKKSLELQEVVKFVPLNKILIETDSPYLAPQIYRGKRNEPSYVVEVAKMIAELKNVSFEEVEKQTTENFKKLFKKAGL